MTLKKKTRFISVYTKIVMVGIFGLCLTTPSPLLFGEDKVVTITAYLTNQNGPLNGSYPIKVALLNDSNTSIWEESHTIIFTKGNFSLPIGGGSTQLHLLRN